VSLFWSGFTSILGFFMVFRNNTAYARFWEGTALMREMRGEWMNAGSSLIAFCSSRADRMTEVKQFQAVLARLLSMMHCSALQTVAEVEDHHFQILSPMGIDPERLRFLTGSTKRTEIILQWVQRLIVEAARGGVLEIPPPILSRVFQELSRGIVNYHNVRKIKEVPLPFPYAQMITIMLVVHWLLTPLIASQMIASPILAFMLSMILQTSLWSIIYIALEIEQPFGEDMNDLPMADMQVEFNDFLELLLVEQVQTAPEYTKFSASTTPDELRRCSFGAEDIEDVIDSQKATFIRLGSWPMAPLKRIFSPASDKNKEASDARRPSIATVSSSDSWTPANLKQKQPTPPIVSVPVPKPIIPALRGRTSGAKTPAPSTIPAPAPGPVGNGSESPMRSRPRPSPKGGWNMPKDFELVTPRDDGPQGVECEFPPHTETSCTSSSAGRGPSLDSGPPAELNTVV